MLQNSNVVRKHTSKERCRSDRKEMAAIEGGREGLNLKAKCKAGSEEAGRESQVQNQGEVKRGEAFLPSGRSADGRKRGGSGGLWRVVKSLSSHLLTSHGSEWKNSCGLHTSTSKRPPWAQFSCLHTQAGTRQHVTQRACFNPVCHTCAYLLIYRRAVC